MINLHAAGLNDKEAQCYTTLLHMTDCKPSELAKIVKETRTNCYKILDKLNSLGLVERLENGPLLRYRAVNPTKLLELAREQRAQQAKAEEELGLHVKSLLASYAKTHERPGIRHYTGKDEIKEIFEDQVRTARSIYFILTPASIDYYGFQEMKDIRLKPAQAGLRRFGITPDNPFVTADYHEGDKRSRLIRTWMEAEDYTAPVEWGCYGDKVYVITFGEEASGMTIESAPMAKAFRQLYKLLDRGLQAQTAYKELPRLAVSSTKRPV